MPQGSVLEPDGPSAQGKFGQIHCTNGKIYLFHNTANLQVNDPVIFDLESGKATVKITKGGSYSGVLAIAVLPKEYNNVDSNGKWKNAKLNKKWKDDWSKVSELQLKTVDLDREKVNNYSRYKK